MSESTTDPPPRGTWATLFQQTSDAVVLLNPRRRIRYVNRAFETLARVPADQIVHEYCHPRKIQKDLPSARRLLLQALSPPREVLEGRSVRVRRTVPPAKLGPPWWEILFLPIMDGTRLLAVLAKVEPIGVAGPAATAKTLSESLAELRQRHVESFSLARWESDRPNIVRLRSLVELASRTLVPVTVLGPPGSGRETLARTIHGLGITRERGFAAIDCRGLQPYLLRSLLAGHNGLIETGRLGTLFLRDADALPPDLLAELLEWRELLEDECRLVLSLTEPGRMPADIRAVLSTIEITVPSVAERREELPRFVEELASMGIAPEAMALLGDYPWPGNFRELREVMAQSAQRAGGGRIDPAHLPRTIRESAVHARNAAQADRPRAAPSLDEILEKVERRMIEQALLVCRGDQTAAAARLGLHRSRLIRRLKALGLDSGATGEEGS